jgi:hypothetical protein
VLDWVGLNLGSRLELLPSSDSELGVQVHWPEGVPQDDNGWPITPEDHTDILKEAERQLTLPLWITSVGITDHDGNRQVNYLDRELKALDPFLTGNHPSTVQAYFFRSLYETPTTSGLIHCTIPESPTEAGPPALNCDQSEAFRFLQKEFGRRRSNPARPVL